MNRVKLSGMTEFHPPMFVAEYKKQDTSNKIQPNDEIRMTNDENNKQPNDEIRMTNDENNKQTNDEICVCRQADE